MTKDIEEKIDDFLEELIRKQYKEKEERILNSIVNAFSAEGYMVFKEDIREVFEKANAYDDLGIMQGIESFKGVYTEYGKRCKNLENELEHIKNTLRELLGETDG